MPAAQALQALLSTPHATLKRTRRERSAVTTRAVNSNPNGAVMQPTRVSKATAAAASPPVLKLPPKMTLWKAFVFNGAAPELINGRLAMLAFLIASSTEARTGEMFLDQFLHGQVHEFLFFGLWIWASMIPIMAGARSEPFGIFTPKAEITNGRAAMLGFACILALEYKSGVPFF